MKFNTLLPAFALVLIYGCGGNTEKEAPRAREKPTEEKKEVCTYSYNPSSTEVMWVAYKYTEKTGVKGVFDSLVVSGVSEGTSPAEVFQNATFEIYTESVNSGDATRDPKIRASFFGAMKGSDRLTGKVSSVTGNEKEGNIIFSVTMNGEEQPVEGAYTLQGEKLEVKAGINVNDWKASPAIEELNKVCEELHQGADGKSVLWPDVSLFISTVLNKDCK